MDKLITSSPTTLEWIGIIKLKIEKKIPSLAYDESEYWASFRSPETKRNIVYLQPQKGQVRLFTRLDQSFDNSLKPTPSSSKWAETFPSVFLIRTKNSIDKACDLIISSYKEDLCG
jgi:hypothetical protein